MGFKCLPFARLKRVRRAVANLPQRHVVPLCRLVVFFCVVFFFLFSWYTYRRESLYTSRVFCHGKRTVYIPPNATQVAASCEWDDHERPLMVLYGTVKGTGDKKFEANDPFNPFIIMDRTLRNWASLSGVQTVIFTEDEGVINYINNLNEEIQRDVAEHGLNATYHNVIHSIQQFEHSTKVKRAPTYRGMLRAIIEAYPGADLFVFANADILFTSTLMKTARFVQRYYDCVVKPNNPLMHGLFTTGRRTNVQAPPDWNPWTNTESTKLTTPESWKSLPPWERAALSLAKTKGQMQHPSSMDYFIYTPDTLDWNYDFEENDYLIGGIHFDLLWTGSSDLMTERGEVFTVDTSNTVLALHQNGQKISNASGITWQSFYNRQMTTAAGDRDFILSNDRVYRMPFFTGTSPSVRPDAYRFNVPRYRPLDDMYMLRRNKCLSR